GEAGEQDLDRDAPVQPSLTREVYVRHPAAPNRRLDVVGVGERRAQIGQIQLRRLSHRALHYPARPRKFAALLLDTDAVSGADSAAYDGPLHRASALHPAHRVARGVDAAGDCPRGFTGPDLWCLQRLPRAEDLTHRQRLDPDRGAVDHDL